jgi:hypothetical protein
MKKQINEPDFIGGQGALTKEEEVALSAFFSKKNKINKHEIKRVPRKKKTGQLEHA